MMREIVHRAWWDWQVKLILCGAEAPTKQLTDSLGRLLEMSSPGLRGSSPGWTGNIELKGNTETQNYHRLTKHFWPKILLNVKCCQRCHDNNQCRALSKMRKSVISFLSLLWEIVLQYQNRYGYFHHITFDRALSSNMISDPLHWSVQLSADFQSPFFKKKKKT